MADRLLDQMARTSKRVQEVLESISASGRNRRLLAGIADITQVLLADDDLDAAVAYALRRARTLAEASEVEVGRLVEMDGREVFVPYAADPAFDNPRMQIDLAAVGASSWLARFHRGEAVRASADDLAGAARELFERYGSSSILFLPIPGTTKAWGVVGFSSEDASREWTEPEEAMLGALAASLGAALWRREAAQQEIDAQRRAMEEHREEALLLMARGVAHDFGNVVQAIEGSLEIARMKGETSPALDLVHRAAGRAKGLAQQLRVVAGLEPSVREPVDPHRLVEESIALVEDVALECTIDAEIADDLPPLIGDPTQLGQVVTNLVRNACEACRDAPGEVELRVDPVLRSRPGIQIAVRDNGRGIDAASQERLLEPFYSTNGQGRGLGLTLASAIVAAHHGEIEVESEPGHGTQVQVWLPSGLH